MEIDTGIDTVRSKIELTFEIIIIFQMSVAFPNNFPEEFIDKFKPYLDRIFRDSYNHCIQSLFTLWKNKDNLDNRKQFYSMDSLGFESQYYDFALFTDVQFKSICNQFMAKYYPCPFCNNDNTNIECIKPYGH